MVLSEVYSSVNFEFMGGLECNEAGGIGYKNLETKGRDATIYILLQK